MEHFQNNIKEWVNYDNQIQQYNKELKELRSNRNNILDSILEYSNNNSLNNHTIQITDGRLKFGYVKQYQPLTLQYINRILNDSLDDTNMVETIMTKIRENRPIKIEQNIKRYNNK